MNEDGSERPERQNHADWYTHQSDSYIPIAASDLPWNKDKEPGEECGGGGHSECTTKQPPDDKLYVKACDACGAFLDYSIPYVQEATGRLVCLKCHRPQGAGKDHPMCNPQQRRSRPARVGLWIFKRIGECLWPPHRAVVNSLLALALTHPILRPILAPLWETPLAWAGEQLASVAAWPVWQFCQDQWLGVMLAAGLFGTVSCKALLDHRRDRKA
jgi:hypothetical protein